MEHKSRSWLLSVASIVVVGGIFHWLGRPASTLNAHSFRQTQTLWPVREFAAGNWDFPSPLPVLGPPWQIPFEFPAFQVLAALTSLITGLEVESSARFVSLGLFVVTGIMLAVVIRRWFGSAAGLISATVFAFSPFAHQWAAATLIEYLPLALILLAILLQDSAAARKFGWLVSLAGTALLISVASAIKVTTVVPWMPLILIAIWLGSSGRGLRRRFSAMAVVALSSFVVTLVWTNYADAVKERSPLTATLTSSNLGSHNFGSVEQRFDPTNYVVIYERLDTLGALASVWVIALLVLGVHTRWSLPVVGLALVPALAVAAFINLYVAHDYYFAAISPAWAGIVGGGIAAIGSRIASAGTRRGFLLLSTFFVIALSYISVDGIRLSEMWKRESTLPPLSAVLVSNTQVSDQIAVMGCDWDSTVLYYANRRGIAVPNWWQERLPASSLQDVSYVASCAGFYEPGDNPRLEVLPDDWRLIPVTQGLWRVVLPVS